MKKIGVMTMVAGAFSAAVIGLAGPAQADDHGSGSHSSSSSRDRDSNYYGNDRSNNPWAGQLIPDVKVPKVDTSVRN